MNAGRRFPVVVAVVAALVLTGPVAEAAPVPPPQPPPAQPLPEGPWPPSEVLAADPATVTPPEVTARAATVGCPVPPAGIQRSAPGAGKTVALTFDDGPGASTDAILAILRQEGVAATFFELGINQQARPATVRAIRDQGFLLANHTWSHPDMSRLSSSAQAAEMDNASNQQQSIVGSRPCFFRPPYGAYNSTTLTLANNRGMGVWNWSVDTEDWKANGSGDQVWVNRIISLNQAGGSQTHPVVLMHDQPGGNPATVKALPTIIDFYRDRGYTFVDLAGRTRVTDRPVTGDWNGDGITTVGVVRGSTWYLRNSNTPGPPDLVFNYGNAADRVVTGDWDGNGTTTPGVVRGSRWYLRNANSGGPGTIAFDYGGPGDRLITGDWDGNGTFTPGIVRGARWYLRNGNSTGPGTIVFDYGGPSDLQVTGDWDRNNTFTPGILRGNRWYLRNGNSTGPGTIAFDFAPSGG